MNYGHVSSERQHTSGDESTRHNIERNLLEPRDVNAVTRLVRTIELRQWWNQFALFEILPRRHPPHVKFDNDFATWKQHPSATHETHVIRVTAWGMIYGTSAFCSNLTYPRTMNCCDILCTQHTSLYKFDSFIFVEINVVEHIKCYPSTHPPKKGPDYISKWIFNKSTGNSIKVTTPTTFSKR